MPLFQVKRTQNDMLGVGVTLAGAELFSQKWAELGPWVAVG